VALKAPGEPFEVDIIEFGDECPAEIGVILVQHKEQISVRTDDLTCESAGDKHPVIISHHAASGGPD
jgi:hypothetical protein